jgi:hypothetical protein
VKHNLTKSNFKLGSECLFKLKYYKAKYPSSSQDNEMLKFFANGGFMVEAIAHAVMSQNPNVEFEKTLEFGRYSARLDAFEQTAAHIVLTEIKAKGVENSGVDQFLSKTDRKVLKNWRPYMLDIAFQVMVTEANFPGVKVIPQLCLVNKNKATGIDGIYSNVDLIKDNDSRDFSLPSAVYTGNVAALRADHFLEFINVRECVDSLMEEVKEQASAMLDFLDGNTVDVVPGRSAKLCKKCEYREVDSIKDGFSDCWGDVPHRGENVIDLYRLGNGSAQLKAEVAERIEDRRLLLTSIPDSLLEGGKAYGQTRRNQVAAERSGREYFSPELRDKMVELEYPLHFIDFETSSIPVPYLPGMKPFEMIAFQFSCHTLETPESTELIHREWLNLKDIYPNVEFLQELRRVIGDEGSVLIWHNYELTVLRAVRRQLSERGTLTKDLEDWLETLIESDDGVSERSASSRVVDLLKVSEAHYCHPQMKGSHSIKKVLDAVWSDAPHLWNDGWFAEYYKTDDSSKPIDPYKTLSSPVEEFNLGADEESDVSEVSDGVGAMRAYQDMLFGIHRNDPAIRDQMRDSLLRYCGLDTAAMVMIWKHWTKVSA